MKKFAIIVAGGTGTRMKTGTPKQFLLLGGKPMLTYSIEAFHRACPGISIVLALPPGEFTNWQELCQRHAFILPHQLVAGGETRFHSVQNALSIIDDDSLVAIHDGARPLVSESLIREAFMTAEQLGNCIPVIPVNESVRLLTGGDDRSSNRTIHRADLKIVQTPQVFHAAIIKKAYEQGFREMFTDDAMVAESIGETIHLIDGDPANLKITHPYDLVAAEALLGNL
ncbi:MAG: 2-C-methyl-D-erythritol 4-phosphate cytidylyltransferase [Bacteroidetes bacterium]|nr:2-C-methyl-D-erythritol 4-phosphate cytidylyltransferase [Bacteroidota bacterium]